MVIVPDRVSEWIAKGEVVDRYFNPGSIFEHIDLVLTNDDRPDQQALQRMAGPASIDLHHLPAGRGLFAASLGWRPSLLRSWARGAVELARSRQPRLIRCHGVRLNTFAAAEIKRALGVPYVVSVHANPDLDQLRGRRATTPTRRLVGSMVQPLETHGLQHADLVMPVYRSIVPYLERLHIERYQVVYNVVGHGITPRVSWPLSDPPHLVCVGRQERGEKDPRPIIEAVTALPGIRLTVVGDGPLHGEIEHIVARSAARGRIQLVQALPNEEILQLMSSADMFVYQSDIHELSKTCIEAALSGLPIIANDRHGEPAPEMRGDHVRLVTGTAVSYRAAIAELLDDHEGREHLGRRALERAGRDWHPSRTEAHVAAIYETIARPA
jgi:glycosyltransferase involved in cell wall biosynthesis